MGTHQKLDFVDTNILKNNLQRFETISPRHRGAKCVRQLGGRRFKPEKLNFQSKSCGKM